MPCMRFPCSLPAMYAGGRRRVAGSVRREDDAPALPDEELPDAVLADDVLQPHARLTRFLDLDLLAVVDDVAAERQHGLAARGGASHDEGASERTRRRARDRRRCLVD